MQTEEMSILRDSEQEWLPIPLPGSDGVMIKVLKADVKADRVVAKILFEPGSSLPRHVHHCRAVAYTVDGGWSYDEGAFSPGEVAWEEVGNDHTPVSEHGSELFVVFDGQDGRYLDNYLSDGSIVEIGMPLFEALQGLTHDQALTLDVASLVTIRRPATQ